MLDDHFKDHIDVSFSLMTNDWHKSEAEGRFSHLTFPVKQCTHEDFSHDGNIDNGVKKMFASWDGITILCPDLPKDIDPALYGDTGSMKSQFWKFSIAQCTNRPTCKNDTEIEKYIKDIQVDNWIKQDQQDYSLFEKYRPTYII